MSAYNFFEITCDWPGCYARFESHRTKVTEARADAAKNGWSRVAGLIDLCGTQEQKRHTYQPGATEWRGCAARTDHLPVVKPASKGYQWLSCTCGWVYESQYSWIVKGQVSLGSTRLQWEKHVEDELKKEADYSKTD